MEREHVARLFYFFNSWAGSVLSQLFMVRRAKVRCVGQLCVKSLKVNNMCSPLFLLSLNSSAKNNKKQKEYRTPNPVHPVRKEWSGGAEVTVPGQSHGCSCKSHRSLPYYLWLVPPLGYYLRFVFSLIMQDSWGAFIQYHFISFRFCFDSGRVGLGIAFFRNDK